MDTKKICFVLDGCAAHDDEFERIRKNLEGKYEKIHNILEADVIIQFFCAITCASIEDYFKEMSYLKAVKKVNKNAKLIICGCASEVINFKKLYPFVDYCIGRTNINEKVLEILKEEDIIGDDLFVHINKASATINICDGCNNRCSFCKVHYMPLKLKSKPIEQIIKEVYKAIELGAKEIMLFGMNSTQYGIDLYKRPMLSELLKKILQINNEILIDLRGITLKDITPELYEIIKNEERIWKIQLESQSASPIIRKKMNLSSTVEELEYALDTFSNKVYRTNFIVGHPYETEIEFQKTLDFIRRKNIWYTSVAIYMNTPGTLSANMPQVSEEDKEKRENELFDLVFELKKNFFNTYVIGKEIKFYAIGVTYLGNEKRFIIYGFGKGISCKVLINFDDTPENKSKISRIQKFKELTVKILEVLTYSDSDQGVVLQGEFSEEV